MKYYVKSWFYAGGRTEAEYRIVQPHTSQAHQLPGNEGMLAVYRPLIREANGTRDDPIPFVYGMDVEKGKMTQKRLEKYMGLRKYVNLLEFQLANSGHVFAAQDLRLPWVRLDPYVAAEFHGIQRPHHVILEQAPSLPMPPPGPFAPRGRVPGP